VSAALLSPFYERPVSAPARRRLLLVSYHFPPSRAAGALRWQKFARFAVERGWGLDVVCLDPGGLTGGDPARLDDLPGGVRLFGVRQPVLFAERVNRTLLGLRQAWRRRPATAGAAAGESVSSGPAAVGTGIVPRAAIRWRLTAPRDWVRAFDAWLFFAREGVWARAAARVAGALLARGRYDVLLTCGPPHMVHPIGAAVARRAGVPFVMDLRDPWSLATAVSTPLASPVWLRIAAREERRAVAGAALVICNTERAREAMAAAYPAARERFLTVMNGCDDEPVPPPSRGARFVVAYAGAIYLDRDPGPLFRGAARVIGELGLGPADFGIEFIGGVAGGEVALVALARAAGVADYFRCGPSRPRRAMLEFLAGAAVLVSLPQDLPLALPSKIFEYMQLEAWLLVLARPDSATARALAGSGADVVDPADEAAIAAALRRRWEQFRRGERPPRLADDPRFSRRGQAVVLFDALERLR
jgi:glycosyltransferase involved in cell wall biosynthesis